MHNRFENADLDPVSESGVQRADLDEIKDELAEAVMMIKLNAQNVPFLRELIELRVHLHGSAISYKQEFTFFEIQSGLGLVEKLKTWVAGMEKKRKNSPIILEVFLYPYEMRGGKKLMRKALKSFVARAPDFKPLSVETKPSEMGVVLSTRTSTRTRVKEANVLENKLPLPLESIEMEAGEIKAEEVEIADKKEQLRKGFSQDPIDFDYRKWRLWSTDATRGILKRTFDKHNITSPGDLMNFLGTIDPSKEEWTDFINRLNAHDSFPKPSLGQGSEFTLLRWMRRNKMIPESFRIN